MIYEWKDCHDWYVLPHLILRRNTVIRNEYKGSQIFKREKYTPISICEYMSWFFINDGGDETWEKAEKL